MKRFFDGKEVKRTQKLSNGNIRVIFVGDRKGDPGEQKEFPIEQYLQGVRREQVQAKSLPLA